MLATLLLTLLTSVVTPQPEVPTDSLVADDFDYAEFCVIEDDTIANELQLMPWLRTDFGRMNAAQSLVDKATSYIGLPYRKGGKTERGFDCSGFTGFLFRTIGINLGASSRDQAKQGAPIKNQSSLREGDLVFFSGQAGGKSRVGHVGMVIDRDPRTGVVRFIHSTHRSGITVSRLDEPYYAARYITARRLL